MAGLKQTRANAVLNSELGVSPSSNRWLALYTVMPTATTAGTEVSGGSYARRPIAFSSASGGATSSSSTVTFAAATAAWGTVAGWAVVDASSGGNQITFDTFDSSFSVGIGDVIEVNSGDLDVSLA